MRMYPENMQTLYVIVLVVVVVAPWVTFAYAFRERLVRESLRRSTRETFSVGIRTSDPRLNLGDSTRETAWLQIYASCVSVLLNWISEKISLIKVETRFYQSSVIMYSHNVIIWSLMKTFILLLHLIFHMIMTVRFHWKINYHY